MKNPLKIIGGGILNAVKALFGKGPWSDEYATAVSYAPRALEAIKELVDFTSTNSDDALLAKATAYITGPISRADLLDVRKKNDILRAIARGILQGALTKVEPEHVLNLAIELAFTAFKNKI